MKNPYGSLNYGPQEWGRKARKEENRLRNLSHTADREVIEEPLADIEEDQ